MHRGRDRGRPGRGDGEGTNMTSAITATGLRVRGRSGRSNGRRGGGSWPARSGPRRRSRWWYPARLRLLLARADSGDADGDTGRVGEDVVDGRALLRLRDQRPDLLGGGVGVDLVADPDGAEAVTNVRVGAENPVQVHLRGHGGPDRP